MRLTDIIYGLLLIAIAFKVTKISNEMTMVNYQLDNICTTAKTVYK